VHNFLMTGGDVSARRQRTIRRRLMAVITISREYGSRGNAIARLLCERLGYRYFDKDLMEQLGAEMGVESETIAGLPEDKQHRTRGYVERFFASMPTLTGDIGWRTAARVEVAAQMERVSAQTVESLIRAAYEQDNVVVVGRAAQVVLRNAPAVLHVRVVAPIEQRIERTQQTAGLSSDAARELVHQRDQAARDYVKSFYNVDWTDPLLYDLVINTSTLREQASVDLIVQALTALTAAPERVALSTPTGA
jgi:CMP/dCMP kinase